MLRIGQAAHEAPSGPTPLFTELLPAMNIPSVAVELS